MKFFTVYCLALLGIFQHVVGADKARLYVDFDVSMGKETKAYAKKYKKPENKKMLEYLKDLYTKNNLAVVREEKKSKIPHIIHQIWVGPHPLPDNYEYLKSTWLKHHPGWEYKLWTNEEVAKLKLHNQTFYDQATEPAEKANILRYELVYKFGGTYVDIDFEALQPLDLLHRCYDFYTGIEPNDSAHLLNNALIGCTKGHPLMKHCIESIKNDMHLSSRFHRNGVGHFSRSFVAKAHTVPGVSIALPPTYLYPLNVRYPKNMAEIPCLKPESFAVHYWAMKNGSYMPKVTYASKPSTTQQ
jgi:mannosyltransferase OCH1-like enzyme